MTMRNSFTLFHPTAAEAETEEDLTKVPEGHLEHPFATNLFEDDEPNEPAPAEGEEIPPAPPEPAPSEPAPSPAPAAEAPKPDPRDEEIAKLRREVEEERQFRLRNQPQPAPQPQAPPPPPKPAGPTMAEVRDKLEDANDRLILAAAEGRTADLPAIRAEAKQFAAQIEAMRDEEIDRRAEAKAKAALEPYQPAMQSAQRQAHTEFLTNWGKAALAEDAQAIADAGYDPTPIASLNPLRYAQRVDALMIERAQKEAWNYTDAALKAIARKELLAEAKAAAPDPGQPAPPAPTPDPKKKTPPAPSGSAAPPNPGTPSAPAPAVPQAPNEGEGGPDTRNDAFKLMMNAHSANQRK